MTSHVCRKYSVIRSWLHCYFCVRFISFLILLYAPLIVSGYISLLFIERVIPVLCVWFVSTRSITLFIPRFSCHWCTGECLETGYFFCILAGRSRFWQSRCPFSSDTSVHAYTNMQLPIFWPHVQYNERDILVHIIMLNFRASLSGPELYYVA